jgi:superfamily II RNA helicase
VQPASPELEALLQAAADSRDADYAVNMEQLQALFPFKLDGFQEKAVQQLLDGKSVVVCAPTGVFDLLYFGYCVTRHVMSVSKTPV